MQAASYPCEEGKAPGSPPAHPLHLEFESNVAKDRREEECGGEF